MLRGGSAAGFFLKDELAAMKWSNHQITTLAGTYVLSGNLPFSLAVAAFSHLPDMVEFGPGKLIFSRHRGASHSVLLWVSVLILALPFAYHPLFQNTAVMFGHWGFKPWWVIAPGLGALFHLLEDALSISGIKLWGNKKIAVRLYRTGTPGEYAVTLGIVGLMIPFAYLLHHLR